MAAQTRLLRRRSRSRDCASPEGRRGLPAQWEAQPGRTATRCVISGERGLGVSQPARCWLATVMYVSNSLNSSVHPLPPPPPADERACCQRREWERCRDGPARRRVGRAEGTGRDRHAQSARGDASGWWSRAWWRRNARRGGRGGGGNGRPRPAGGAHWLSCSPVTCLIERFDRS